MNPEQVFCPNVECPAKGQVNKGNISAHSHKEKRYRCDVCGATFSASKGTLFYRLKTDPQTAMLVLVLLAHGCPLPAIVVAFGFDERTVKSWWQKAGNHSRKVHQHQVGQSQLDTSAALSTGLGQVQADEIRVKTQQGVIWMALAIMVSTRLWLGGVISAKRDKGLIRALVEQIRQIALCRPLLIAVDGLSSYVKAFQDAFRTKLPRYGQAGRAKLRAWPELHIVQVIKKRSTSGFSITRRIVQGSAEQITALLSSTQNGGKINTAYIERLNATFRQHLSYLARRTRHLAQKPETLEAGMYFTGCMYNFCTYHQSLRIPLLLPDGSTRWLKRTPATAAGLTDHKWSVEELLTFKVPPPRWTPPKQRGRPSSATLALVKQWAS